METNINKQARTPNEGIVIDADILAHNKKLADILTLVGSYYVMAKDTYRAKAFNNAGAKIGHHPIAILSGAQARMELAGIGDSIQSAIDEYIANGSIVRLQELEARFQDRKQVIDYFLSFYGIGPVTAVNFYNQGFRTLEDLWFKANLTDAQKIGIMWREHFILRIPRGETDIISTKIGSLLNPYGIKWNIAGSYRREETSSGDVDVLVESRPDLNMDGIITVMRDILPATLAQGQTLYLGVIRISNEYNGHRIDIRLVDPAAYPFTLMHFTGSQRFNILMRQRAIQFNMTLNEYGLFDNNGSPTAAQSEEDVFRILRVVYIPPVERTKTINSLKYL